MKHGPRLTVVFYRTEQGNEPVRIWLLSLAKGERKVIGTDILKIQYGWPIGMPLVKSLGEGLWEVRSRLSARIARVIFLMQGNTMVLLHGFIKQTQKTPPKELAVGRDRRRRLLE